MGNRFSHPRILLLTIAVAALAQGCSACDDSGGLSGYCRLNYPCGITQDGSHISAVEFKNSPLYSTGQCQFGKFECDDSGKEICVGFVAPTEEVCDGLDNNCDGLIDESFDLDNDGYTTCEGDCNDRSRFIHPGAPERCDGLDNNCDESIDNDIKPIACWSGPNEVILDGTTSCKKGEQYCINGAWSPCNNQVLPGAETCNQIDDDCDGVVDNIRFTICGPGRAVGICEYGRTICDGGESKCIDAIYPEAETCDGADNDCDGAVDEGIIRRCATACGNGVEECNAGTWENCDAPQPETEICDGLDNDCDGEVDEGCNCLEGQARVCNQNVINPVTNQIVDCGVGVEICDEYGVWGPCYFFNTSPETCNNWDDDCDGVVDGMSQVCGNTTTAGIGECRVGTSSCSAGQWSPCIGAVSPQQEICDQLDNDCDGAIDEDLNPHDKVDMVFAIDISGSMCPFITALAQGIAQYVDQFQTTEHRFALVAFPGVYPNNSNLTQELRTMPALVDVGTFRSILLGLTCNGGGNEPSWDVMYNLTDPADPVGIGWRPDAYPYIVMVTDEPGQSWVGIQEPQVQTRNINCQVGECMPGDMYESYVITNTSLFYMWDDIVNNEFDRLVNIYPPDPTRYTDLLRNIFQNICI